MHYTDHSDVKIGLLLSCYDGLTVFLFLTEKLGLELVESLMPTLIQMTAMFQAHAAKAFQV